MNRQDVSRPEVKGQEPNPGGDALDAMLERIAAGAAPADALAGVPDAATRAHLAPLVATALSLHERPLAPLRPAFRAGLQAALADLEDGAVRFEAHPDRRGRGVRVAAMVAAVVAVLAVGGLAFAAGSSEPGDGLFPIKAFLMDRVDRGGLGGWGSSEFMPESAGSARSAAAERLAEANALLARGGDTVTLLAAIDAAREALEPARPVARRSDAVASGLRRVAPARPTAGASAGGAATDGGVRRDAMEGRVGRGDGGLPTRGPAASGFVTLTAPVPPVSTVEEPDRGRGRDRSTSTSTSTSMPMPIRTPTDPPVTATASPGVDVVTLGGAVTRAGVPVAETVVIAWRSDAGGGCEAAALTPVAERRSDGGGRFVFDDLPPGLYRVSAEGGADCLPRRWCAGAVELATEDPCRAALLDLGRAGDVVLGANVGVGDEVGGGCP